MLRTSHQTGFIPLKTELADTQVFSSVTSGTNIRVPLDVRNLYVKVWGAGGGGGAGYNTSGDIAGAGGYIEGTITVVPGEELIIRVGSGGQGGQDTSGGAGGTNGGGNGGDGNPDGPGNPVAGGGGGGGYTGVLRPGDIVLVVAAGGGGGGSGDDTAFPGEEGGEGGGNIGEDGTASTSGAVPQTDAAGKGGTQSAGGAAGTGINQIIEPTDGDYLQGGEGGFGAAISRGGGGGGGGGYYGGGGACAATQPDTGGSGGGGGSSFLKEGVLISNLTGSGMTPPNTGDGDYIAGVGVGGTAGAGDGAPIDAGGDGGDGLIVIEFLRT